MKQSSKKDSKLLQIMTVAVVVVAALAMVAPKFLRQENNADAIEEVSLSEDGSAVVIDTAKLNESASFFDYDANGVTVELFAVEASDGSIRLALNTCQVCNGSPYAYFVQDGDYFICQNCRNHFASTKVGLVSGGCNPVPITEENYSLQDGTILVSSKFLEENANRFVNWKKF